jgi:enoyl-CoA hydratase/carnithine racemase
MHSLESYASTFAHFAKLTRQNGILTVRFHTDEQSWELRGETRDLLPDLFIHIAHDRENRVVIITGTGDQFCATLNSESLQRELGSWGSDVADRWRFGGNHAVRKMIEIEAPVILCLNGALLQHAEIWMSADIVLAAPEATVQDFHIAGGQVPGGDASVVWETLLGHSRAKYFLLTGQILKAEELHQLGVVHELCDRTTLVDRAQELAIKFTGLNRHVLRYAKASVTERLRRNLAVEQPYTQALVMLGAQSAVPELLAQSQAL